MWYRLNNPVSVAPNITDNCCGQRLNPVISLIFNSIINVVSSYILQVSAVKHFNRFYSASAVSTQIISSSIHTVPYYHDYKAD